MTESALAGDTSIKVGSTSGWNVHDEIVIGPSFRSAKEYEKVNITSISSNTVTFTPPLKHNHYGANSLTINNRFGQLDTRTAVGHITRKIKIIAGNDSGWGYRLLGYGYNDGNRIRIGHLILSGV